MFSAHETKEEKNQEVTSKTPVFDIDDLSYFRFMGLGLRHVELELGIHEAQHGNFKGDAVSLANYGCVEDEKSIFNLATCTTFQMKVESFIRQSFFNYHNPSKQFKDAAFLLLMRGEDAKMPYDFGIYPLGKCGTQAFSANQVVSLMRTDGYHNEDINHAVQNTLINLKEVCRQLKLQKAIALSKQLKEKLDTNPNSTIQCLYDLTITMITHYKNNIFIEQPIFFNIATFITYFIEENYIPDENQITELAAQINAFDTNKIKGEDSIHIIYIPTDFSKLGPQQLNEKLIDCIKSQNLKNVQECLKHMEKSSFISASSSPLLTAAHYADLNILKEVYEFNPQEYDRIVESTNLETPLFATVREGNLATTQYLLTQRKLVPRDVIFGSEHIFSKLAFFSFPEAHELMQLLIEKGVTINSVEDINEQPLARHMLSACRSDIGFKNFKLLLSLSDSKAKYKTIYKITQELSYCRSDDPDWIALLDLRRIVIESLTENERLEIQNKFFPKDPDILFAEPDPFEKQFGYSLHEKQENPPLDKLLEKEMNKNTQNPKLTNEIFAFFSMPSAITADKTKFSTPKKQSSSQQTIQGEKPFHPTPVENNLVQNLKNEIDKLRDYGKELKDKGINKGQVAFILANQLKAYANEFFTDEFFVLPKKEQKEKFEEFMSEFSKKLTSQNKTQSTYRKNLQTIKTNILIALSVIGLFAIAGKLAYSKYKQGRFLLWGSADKTTSEQKIEAINYSIKSINNLLY